MPQTSAFSPLQHGTRESSMASSLVSLLRVRRSRRRACGARSSVLRWSESPTTETRLDGVLMRGPPACVGRRVELDAEPGRVAADALADRRGVLADAGREHERVEAAERPRRASRARARSGRRRDRSAKRGALVARLRAACACRSRCPTRRAGPTAGRSASRSRARPSSARPSGRGSRPDRGCRSACPSAARRRR